jgi:hypothetical protein
LFILWWGLSVKTTSPLITQHAQAKAHPHHNLTPFLLLLELHLLHQGLEEERESSSH